MSQHDEEGSKHTKQPDKEGGNVVSRREFLKLAGMAGAAVGLAGGLGGLAAGCGEEETTTTTAAPASTTSSSEAGSSTTVTTEAEGGRDIKVGVVAPQTGIYAAFAPSATWQIERWNEALKDGVVDGGGKNHKIVTILKDTQSDANRSGQVTGDLVHNDGVDVVFAGGTPDTVNPSADQCEALGVPHISNFVPWQAFFFGRGATPDKPFKWTYSQALGLEQIGGSFIDMADQIPTNKKIAGVMINDSDGIAFSDPQNGTPPMFIAAGYTLTLPGLYPPGAQDFTQQISEFKKEGCEVCLCVQPTPDFETFWTQAAQQGFQPKVAIIALALLFPESATAVGPTVVGCTSELPWYKNWPFKSSLTGETCAQLADDYEQRTGNQASPALGQYARMEWLVDAIKRTADVDDKEALIKAISTTKLETMFGTLDFTLPAQLGTVRPVENVYTPPTAGGQWVKGTGKWPFEIIEVSNKHAPGTEIEAQVQPMVYAS